MAMTSASHAEGRQFDPGQVYFTLAAGWRLEGGGCRLQAAGWRLEAAACRLEAGGWTLLEAGGWRLQVPGWRLERAGIGGNTLT